MEPYYDTYHYKLIYEIFVKSYDIQSVLHG
jgi:hypothetical protein